MNLTELHIGKCYLLNSEPFMLSITHLRDISLGDLNHNDIKPIKLTPEILLQCAFEDLEKYKYRIIIDEFTFVCDFAMKLFKLNGIEINIEHLHQLQNLCFTLTKQELPININALKL